MTSQISIIRALSTPPSAQYIKFNLIAEPSCIDNGKGSFALETDAGSIAGINGLVYDI
jgi:hypothetical protein